MIDLSADYWSTYRPTLSANLSVDTSADSQSTITWHISRHVDPELVYAYGDQESADISIEYRPIVSIEGCTNRPFPSSRKSHFQTEAKCETFVVKRCTCRLQKVHLLLSVFLRIQVHASSQTKGVERGWKQRARLGRDAKNTVFITRPTGVWGSRGSRA